jgi:hypothetical protein
VSTAWNHRGAPVPPSAGRGNTGPRPTPGIRGNTGFPAAVAKRRAKLLDEKKTLGHPADPAGHTNAYVPEPVIEDADYEAILDVLRSARNAMERTPGMCAELGEDDIRDWLLYMLNSHFKGAAAGEVFNRAGKTDILVRAGDRNVFIGECKIYDPKNNQSVEHVVTSAIDQLNDRYLGWREPRQHCCCSSVTPTSPPL